MWHFGPYVTFRPCQCHVFDLPMCLSTLRLFPASGTLPRNPKYLAELRGPRARVHHNQKTPMASQSASDYLPRELKKT